MKIIEKKTPKSKVYKAVNPKVMRKCKFLYFSIWATSVPCPLVTKRHSGVCKNVCYTCNTKSILFWVSLKSCIAILPRKSNQIWFA